MIKKLLVIFTVSFLLNLVWENLHSYLYFHPDGQAMTQAMLLRATLFDAVFITLLAIIFIKISYFRKRKWQALIFGFAVAVLIEVQALGDGRWAYTELMPIIPFLNVGLTPAIQLGVLSYLIFKWQV